MGREIRRVPPNWVHPTYMHRYPDGHMEETPHPLFDEVYEDALAAWKRGQAQWEADEPLDSWDGKRPSEIDPKYPAACSWEDWHGEEPDPEYYRHRRWPAEEATAYQVYETVTEGTPVSPVLGTREELIAWLMGRHEYAGWSWTPMTRRGAESFADAAWAPSEVASPGHGVERGTAYIDRIANEEDET